MQRNLRLRVFVGTLAAAFLFSVSDSSAGQGKPPTVPSSSASDDAAQGKSLPGIFDSVLPKIRAKSRVPILLPDELPDPVAEAKHVVVDEISRDEYALSLHYESDATDSGFAASFSAQAQLGFDPRDLENTHEVKLARGFRGFFRAVSCGGSCAPANLRWEQGGALYQIQMRLPLSLSDRRQEKILVAVTNSAILAGPR